MMRHIITLHLAPLGLSGAAADARRTERTARRVRGEARRRDARRGWRAAAARPENAARAHEREPYDHLPSGANGAVSFERARTAADR